MPKNSIRGIPENFGHIVRGPDGNWVEATPTQTPAPTRTIGPLDKMLYGRAADDVRRQDGGIDWSNLIDLFMLSNDSWMKRHPEDSNGPSQMRTPTPEQAGPHQQGDMELIIKKKAPKTPTPKRSQ